MMNVRASESTRKFSIVLVLSMLFGGLTGYSVSAAESFVDEFNRFDTSRWFASHGWSNGDYQNCTWSKNQVRLNSGRLVLSYENQKFKERENSCGEIQSKGVYGHGIYEARMRADSWSGTISAFFTYIGKVHGKPHDEIDFEIMQKDPSIVEINYFASGEKTTPPIPPYRMEKGADKTFNDYAFVWEEDRLSWYINGKLIRSLSSPRSFPVHDQKIYLSIWGTDTLSEWMGKFETPDRKLRLEVERVSFTKFGEPCLYPESLACLIE